MMIVIIVAIITIVIIFLVVFDGYIYGNKSWSVTLANA